MLFSKFDSDGASELGSELRPRVEWCVGDAQGFEGIGHLSVSSRMIAKRGLGAGQQCFGGVHGSAQGAWQHLPTGRSSM